MGRQAGNLMGRNTDAKKSWSAVPPKQAKLNRQQGAEHWKKKANGGGGEDGRFEAAPKTRGQLDAEGLETDRVVQLGSNRMKKKDRGGAPRREGGKSLDDDNSSCTATDEAPSLHIPFDGATNYICTEAFKAPFELIMYFLPNPGPLRASCTFGQKSWINLFLKKPIHLPCPYVVSSSSSTTRTSLGVPILPHRLYMLGGESDPVTVNCVGLSIVSVPKFKFEADPVTTSGKKKTDIKKAVGPITLVPNVSLLISQWSNLEHIGNGFLRAASILKVVIIHNLPALSAVGSNWLRGCTGLEKAVIQDLPILESIGNNFLHDCPALTEVVFEDLPELASVGNGWLGGCTALHKEILIEKLPKLRSIGDGFLADCALLPAAVVKDLPTLMRVGDGWLRNCVALEKVEIRNLPKFRKISACCLNGSLALVEVKLLDLPLLSIVGADWLEGCTKEGGTRLTVADVPQLNHPKIQELKLEEQ